MFLETDWFLESVTVKDRVHSQFKVYHELIGVQLNDSETEQLEVLSSDQEATNSHQIVNWL